MSAPKEDSRQKDSPSNKSRKGGNSEYTPEVTPRITPEHYPVNSPLDKPSNENQ